MSSQQSAQSNHVNNREYASAPQSKNNTRDQIIVHQYKNDQFLQPEELQTHIALTNRNQPLLTLNTSQPPNSANYKQTPPPSPNNPNKKLTTFPAKKPATNQRSSLQQSQDEQQKIRKQLILEFKISELQKICTTLTSANQKLLDKIQQLQEENDQYKGKITMLEKQVQYHEDNNNNNNSREQQSNQYVESVNDDSQQQQNDVKTIKQQAQQLMAEDDDYDDETKLLQEQVVDIQKLIKQYRQQLTKAEQLNTRIKDNYSQNIASLEQQLSQVQQQLNKTLSINSQLEQQLIESQQKNQSLTQDLQNILNSTQQQHYIEDGTSRNRTDSRSSQFLTPVNQRHPFGSRNYRPSYYQENYSQQITPFDSSVQLQLEKLIQKLVKELQNQRNIKKRMNDQIKRIQKDLLESQKQIMLKNKKIYQLEMNLLKGEKNHLFTQGTVLSNSQIQLLNQGRTTNQHRAEQRPNNKYSMFSPHRQQQNRRNYNSPNTREISPKIRDKYLQHQRQRINTSAVNYSPSHRDPVVSQAYLKPKQYISSRNPNISQSPSSAQTKHLQTFSLLELMNQPTITLTIKEKLHICLKLVEFYQQKIYQYKNYNLLMLENILVTNFNRIKLGLIKIRVQEHKKSDQGRNPRLRKNSKDDIADGPEKVIWNLGFLLNSLLLDIPTKEDDLGSSESEKNILSVIDNILDNRNLSKEVFQQLKEHLSVALSERAQ